MLNLSPAPSCTFGAEQEKKMTIPGSLDLRDSKWYILPI